jgi:hypothetical protein
VHYVVRQAARCLRRSDAAPRRCRLFTIRQYAHIVADDAPALTIDVGGSYGWHLSVAEPGAVRSVRDMTDDEVRTVTAALNTVREHMDQTAMTLLVGAHQRVIDVATGLRPSRPLTPSDPRKKLNEVAVPLVSWVLTWGMVLDHALHDISDKYPDDRGPLKALAGATHQAFDAHPGYRMAEGLRDYVAHRGMPPLQIQGTVRRGRNDERLESVTVRLVAERLLEDTKFSGHVRRDIESGEALLGLSELVGDAMAGMQAVMAKYSELLEPGLVPNLELLVALLSETAPHVPFFVRVDEQHQISMAAMDDVLPFLIFWGYIRDSGEPLSA